MGNVRWVESGDPCKGCRRVTGSCFIRESLVNSRAYACLRCYTNRQKCDRIPPSGSVQGVRKSALTHDPPASLDLTEVVAPPKEARRVRFLGEGGESEEEGVSPGMVMRRVTELMGKGATGAPTREKEKEVDEVMNETMGETIQERQGGETDLGREAHPEMDVVEVDIVPKDAPQWKEKGEQTNDDNNSKYTLPSDASLDHN